MPTKRKKSSLATAEAPTNSLTPVLHDTPIHPPSSVTTIEPHISERKRSRRDKINTNPDHNADIADEEAALRASPDADEKGELLGVKPVNGDTPAIPPIKSDSMKRALKVDEVETALSDASEIRPVHMPAKTQKKSLTKSSLAEKKGLDEIKSFKAAKTAADSKFKKEADEDKCDKKADPDGDEAAPAEDVDVMKKEAKRHPPVHSDYLPLPWKGRLGYVSLCWSYKEEQLANDWLLGMPKHILAIFQPSHFHIPYLPHSLHPRAPASLERPHTA
jgi:UV DNA damage endonuclease